MKGWKNRNGGELKLVTSNPNMCQLCYKPPGEAKGTPWFVGNGQARVMNCTRALHVSVVRVRVALIIRKDMVGLRTCTLTAMKGHLRVVEGEAQLLRRKDDIRVYDVCAVMRRKVNRRVEGQVSPLHALGVEGAEQQALARAPVAARAELLVHPGAEEHYGIHDYRITESKCL